MALKLATFNLYQFAAPGTFWYEEKARNSYTDADWAAKKDWIATRLAEMAADVVGFQEVFAVDALRDLCRAAGYAHFATVDTPQISPDNPRVFTAPVVALAARFPIQEAKAVGVDAAVKDQLPVEESFDFSRRPIRAVVDCPPHGPLVVVVAHLKSKRPIVPPPAFSDTADWDHKVQETLRATSRGHAAALLQRGAEAAALYHALTAQIATDPDMPIVVLGDLNDDPHSIPLEALTLSGPVHQIDGKAKADWPRAVRPALYTYRFYDAWILAAPKGAPRPPTHFHGGEGGVLDYILVSNPLNAKNPHHIARVGACEIFNAHLQNDGVGNHKQSDHGQVAVTLAIKDQTQPMAVAAAPARPQASSAERDRFLHAAGGVFASPVDFGYWESRDKYENFWAFFFDHDYGWVKSAYGDIPITTLHQKRRYSIEHVVPRGFLSEYLRRNGAATGIQRGSTVNPLNFVAAERAANAQRNSFPFDWDGDSIRRPRRLTLDPQVYVTVGFDHENQWVVPSRSRGDLARAILYMTIVYQVRDLYNSHVDQLRHWAKVDVATPWELDYNRWVAARLGIRNPFIDRPEAALRWLDDDALMASIQSPSPPTSR